MKPNPIGDQSQGEARVADYLMRRAIELEYEPLIGGRTPDFLAHHPVAGDVVLEVYEPSLRLSNGSGSFDPVPAIEGAFKDRKRKQAKAAREAGLPFVIVVPSTNSDVPFDEFAAIGALRGRPGVAFPVADAVGHASPETVRSTLIGIGMTGGKQNTSVSALALIEWFNPTQWRLERALAAHVPELSGGDVDDARRRRHTAECLRLGAALAAELEATGVYRPGLRRPRLSIFRNLDAAVPLPLSFGGGFDEQWGSTSSAAGEPAYGPLAYGIESWRWIEALD